MPVLGLCAFGFVDVFSVASLFPSLGCHFRVRVAAAASIAVFAHPFQRCTDPRLTSFDLMHSVDQIVG